MWALTFSAHSQEPGITFPKLRDTIWFEENFHNYVISPDTLYMWKPRTGTHKVPVRVYSANLPIYSFDSLLIAWDDNAVYFPAADVDRVPVYESRVRYNKFEFRVKPGTDSDVDSDTTDSIVLLRKKYDQALNDTVYWWICHFPYEWIDATHFTARYRGDDIILFSRHHGIVGAATYTYEGDDNTFRFHYTVGEARFFDEGLEPLIKAVDPPDE